MPAPALHRRRSPRTRLRAPGLGASVALAVGFAAGTGCGAGEGGAGTPRLVLGEELRDFGDVWEGSILEHDFPLRVAGGPVAVHSVSTDCGCTGSELLVIGPSGDPEPYVETTPLPPGTELRLRVRYSTRGRTGRVPRQVHLYGDQGGGETTVTVAANVRRWMDVEPERRTLGPMRTDEVRETTFVVDGRTGEAFLLEPTGEGLPPSVLVTTRPVDPDDDGRAERWTVGVRVGPGLSEGVRGYPIRLAADVVNPDAPPDVDGRFLVMPLITVEVVGPLSLRPPVVTFGGLGTDEIASRTLRLTAYDPAFELGELRARLLDVEGDGESPLAGTATIRFHPVPEDTNARDVELVLDGLGPDVPTRFLARLVVETAHPERPVLEAKVSGYRRDLPLAPASGTRAETRPENRAGTRDGAPRPAPRAGEGGGA